MSSRTTESNDDIFYGIFPKYRKKNESVTYPLTKVRRGACKLQFDILITQDLNWYYLGSTDKPELYEDLYDLMEFLEEGYMIVDITKNKKIKEMKY